MSAEGLLFATAGIDLLPYEGRATYYAAVLDTDRAAAAFATFEREIEWANDEAFIMGRRIVTKRMVAWYGDKEYSYTYTGSTKQALPWTPELLELKDIAERITSARFNSCLLNLYHDGSEGLGWHSDNEDSLVAGATIASFSLGAERKFLFKHKRSKENVAVMLGNGSLLSMAGATQANWLHSLPRSTKVTEPRINLTFRLMKEQEI